MIAADRFLLMADAARRLGPRALAHWAAHRLVGRRRSLGDEEVPSRLAGIFCDLTPAPPALEEDQAARILAAAHRLCLTPDWHGPFDAAAPALRLDLFTPGDIRPLWETHRLAGLALLAQAHRLAPGEGHAHRAGALLEDWARRNPAFFGPAWACGQEAAFRALNLMLALALLDQDRAPPAPARALLGQLARRIEATPHYAIAQDNNHPVSEAAGLFLCGLGLNDPSLARRGAKRLAACLKRLVSPAGAFAQVSSGYHRLLLDTLSIAEWFRRRHGAPPFPAPFAARAAAATGWLLPLIEPQTGAMPRLGHLDDSALADLSLRGPADARGSAERAARLFLDASAGFHDDPGCQWLGLGPAARDLPRPTLWRGDSLIGWEQGEARLMLRLGTPRFRPGHADFLHVDFWNGPLNLLRDSGTGAYNPPPEAQDWLAHFQGTGAHNTIAFDNIDQMPRLSRFLFARWPRCEALPDGGTLTDWRGNRQTRRISRDGREWVIEDRVSGRFAGLVSRWHLPPGDWVRRSDGVEGSFGRLRLEADAPMHIALNESLHSPAYGRAEPAPVLEQRVPAPVTRLAMRLTLPPAPLRRQRGPGASSSNDNRLRGQCTSRQDA
ncbi:heparinase II/III-family protein [Acetobacteraceae bacterium H6797]|nr:heparinase II/III-family protein [Acetobacteraceae bacterium H6797]